MGRGALPRRRRRRPLTRRPRSRLPPACRPTLRLVCRLFRDLVDGALSPCFSIHLATHLGGRLGRGTVYPSRLDFTTAAARLLARRAAGLACLEVDFDAYGCVFAAQLLEAQPLPLLASVALQNVEAQHVAALRPLPRLRDVCLSRHINGPGGGLPTCNPAWGWLGRPRLEGVSF